MWIMLNNAFLSIVSKDCGPGELLVRARREGDIERVFPDAAVTRYTKSDYLFRAVISRRDVDAALTSSLDDIDYPNFKGSVVEHDLHDAYLKVWHAMAELQPTEPYTGKKRKVAQR